MRAVQKSIFGLVLSLLAILSLAGMSVHAQAQGEKRLALVIGNADYQRDPLATSANDAGLIAQTLQAAGFDVVGARDLDGDSLRKALRDFLDKAQQAGPDTVAFIYLAGYGLQFAGDNYFVPIDAKIDTATAVPIEAVRIGDYMRQLATLRLKAGIIVLDAARNNPFAKSGAPLAGGLALVEPEPRTLLAFNAAPGTVAPPEQGPYGAYAHALAEMIREGGLRLNDVFDRVRLRVNEMTKGAEVPWNQSRVQAPFVFFERAREAGVRAPSTEAVELRTRPIRELSARDAYLAALDRDTLVAYEAFLAVYPRDPMAPRVRAIIAVRREELTWRRTVRVDTPRAYWSYLRRYPRGPHRADAERRLSELAAAAEPPPSFMVMDYDVPPPPPAEIIYIDRPVIYFGDPDFDFEPPPPPPVYFLPPPPPDFVVLLPPPLPVAVFVLPVPVFVPMARVVYPPPYIVPPPHNIFYEQAYQRTDGRGVLGAAGVAAFREPQAPLHVPLAAAAAGAAAGAAAAHILLPPSIARKASTMGHQPPLGGTPGQPAPGPGQPVVPGIGKGQPLPVPHGPVAPLPGKAGQPLPLGLKPGQPGQPLPGIGKGQPLPTIQGPGAPLPGKAGQPLPLGLKPGQPGQPLRGIGKGQPLPNSQGRGAALQGKGGQPLPRGLTPGQGHSIPLTPQPHVGPGLQKPGEKVLIPQHKPVLQGYPQKQLHGVPEHRPPTFIKPEQKLPVQGPQKQLQMKPQLPHPLEQRQMQHLPPPQLRMPVHPQPRQIQVPYQQPRPQPMHVPPPPPQMQQRALPAPVQQRPIQMPHPQPQSHPLPHIAPQIPTCGVPGRPPCR